MWKQPGFVVISDALGGLPMVHVFEMAEWEAQSEEGRLIQQLPEDLRVNLRILPAILNF